MKLMQSSKASPNQIYLILRKILFFKILNIILRFCVLLFFQPYSVFINKFLIDRRKKSKPDSSANLTALRPKGYLKTQLQRSYKHSRTQLSKPLRPQFAAFRIGKKRLQQALQLRQVEGGGGVVANGGAVIQGKDFGLLLHIEAVEVQYGVEHGQAVGAVFQVAQT